MRHRRTISVVCAVVIVLAGCSGLVPTSGDSTDADLNATTTAKGERIQPETPIGTTTAETTPVITPGADARSYPLGYSASGISDPKRAAIYHTLHLLTHDNFTITSNTTRGYAYDQDVWQSRNRSYRVDTTDKHAYFIINGSSSSGVSGSSTSYYAEDTVYTRYISEFQENSSDLYYTVESSSFTLTNMTARWRVYTFLLSIDYGSAEWVTRDGVTLIRYETTDVRDARDTGALIGTDIKPSTTAKFHAAVLVDREGIVRNITFVIVHENGASRHVTYRVNKLDATPVEKPNWLDEAKAKAANETERASREYEWLSRRGSIADAIDFSN